jgi:hypothetical protein
VHRLHVCGCVLVARLGVIFVRSGAPDGVATGDSH